MSDPISDDRLESELNELADLVRDVPPASAESVARWKAALADELEASRRKPRFAWAPAVPVLAGAFWYTAPMGLQAMAWAAGLGVAYAVGAAHLFALSQEASPEAV